MTYASDIESAPIPAPPTPTSTPDGERPLDRTRPLWTVVVAISGALLLVQTVLGVIADVATAQASLWHGPALATSVLALLTGLWRRWTYVLLIGVPLTCLASLLLLTPGAAAAVFAPARWALWTASFVVFALSASTLLSRPDAHDGVVRSGIDEVPTVRRSIGVGRVVHIVLAPLLLVVPLAAARFHESFERVSAEERVLVHVVVLFVWSVAVYAFFIAPLLNLDADSLKLRRRLDAERAAFRYPRAMARAALLVVALLLTVTGLLLVDP